VNPDLIPRLLLYLGALGTRALTPGCPVNNYTNIPSHISSRISIGVSVGFSGDNASEIDCAYDLAMSGCTSWESCVEGQDHPGVSALGSGFWALQTCGIGPGVIKSENIGNSDRLYGRRFEVDNRKGGQ